MRIARTLSIHVMRETLVYCSLAFLLITLVLLTQNVLRRLDDLLLVGMTPADLRIALGCILPVVLSYALPLSFLVGLLLTLRRLGTDRELEAMRNAGLGPLRLLLPFLLLGLLISMLAGTLSVFVEHEARRDLVTLFRNVAARGAILAPGKFRYIGSRMIFVEERDRDGMLSGVMIYDESQPETPIRVFASSGHFQFDPRTARLELELENGDIHLREAGARNEVARLAAPSSRRDTPNSYRRIRFEAFTYAVDVGPILGDAFGPVRPKQMTRAELDAVVARAAAGDPLTELDQRDPVAYRFEAHRRWALPFAPLLFAGVGVPLALAGERRGRNLSLVLTFGFALCYYALGMTLEQAARGRWLPATVAAWLPNAAYALLAGLLLVSGLKRVPR